MYALMVLPEGRHVGVLLLMASARELRVVFPGRTDTAEFRLIDGRWTSESGEHVELGAVLASDAASAEWVLANAHPRTLSAS